MAVKMRLSRKGRKKAPFYHIIVADARSPRDGKFIEKLGTYNPMTKPATIEIDRNAAYDWLVKGAQPTDTVKAILRFKGVYYKKHLMRGVKKGAMSVEQADVLWQKWIDEKENKIESRRAETLSEKEVLRKLISGEAKAKVVVADEETKDAAHAFKATEDNKPNTEVDASTEPEVPVAEVPVAEVPVAEVPVAEIPVAEVPVEEVSKVEETNVVEEVAESIVSDVVEVAPVDEEIVTASESIGDTVEESPVAISDEVISETENESASEAKEVEAPTEE